MLEVVALLLLFAAVAIFFGWIALWGFLALNAFAIVGGIIGEIAWLKYGGQALFQVV